MRYLKSGGARSATQGALLLAAIGGPAVLGLIAARAVRGGGSIALVVVVIGLLLGGGAAGGLVHHCTAALRRRGPTGVAAAWCLAAWTSLLVLVFLGRALLHEARLTGMDAARVALLTGWPLVGYLGVAGLLFGLAMSQAQHTDDTGPLLVRLTDDVPRGSMLVWAAAILIGWVMLAVLPQSSQLPLPANASEAREVLPNALIESRVRPRHVQTQLALAYSLLELKRFDDAYPVFERAHRLDPTDSWTLNARGWMLSQQQRHAEAVPHLLHAVRLNSENGEAHHNLGWAQWNLGRLAEAEIAYRAAVRLKSGDAGAASAYAQVLAQRGKKTAAIQQILRATRLDSNNFMHHTNAAFVLRNQARLAEARAHLITSLRLEPNQPYVWAELGVTEYVLNDAAAAVTAFAEARQRDSARFDRQPMYQAMLKSARQGRTGDVRIRFASSPPGRRPAVTPER